MTFLGRKATVTKEVSVSTFTLREFDSAIGGV